MKDCRLRLIPFMSIQNAYDNSKFWLDREAFPVIMIKKNKRGLLACMQETYLS